MPRQLNTSSKYSVPRLEAFQSYRLHARPIWKAFVVCMTPVPACVVAILLDCIPLVSPTRGIAANYAFFLRTFGYSAVLIFGGKWQREFLLKSKPKTVVNTVYTLLGAAIHTGFYWVIPIIVQRFPVPFCPLVAFTISIPILFIMMKVILRHGRHAQVVQVEPGGPVEPQSQDPTPSSSGSHREQMRLVAKYQRLLLFEFTLFFVYSAFAFGFRRVHGVAQVVMAFMLLPIKIVLSEVAARMVRHVEDFAAETVVFTVEFFNSMYVAVCMGGTTSVWSSVALMALDFLHMAFAIYELNRKARLLVESHGKSTGGPSDDQDLLASCIRFAYENQTELMKRGVRFRVSNDLQFTSGTAWKWSNRIEEDAALDKIKISQRASPMPSTDERKIQLVQELLELVFLIEIIVLIEYVEAFTPFFYAAYLGAAFYGANRQFIYGIREMEPNAVHSGIRNMLFYGLLEWLSLGVLFLVVKKRFGVNVLSVLSFVLETQFFNVQGKMLMFLMFIINFPLIHYGMDFSFTFQ